MEIFSCISKSKGKKVPKGGKEFPFKRDIIQFDLLYKSLTETINSHEKEIKNLKARIASLQEKLSKKGNQKAPKMDDPQDINNQLILAYETLKEKEQEIHFMRLNREELLKAKKEKEYENLISAMNNMANRMEKPENINTGKELWKPAISEIHQNQCLDYLKNMSKSHIVLSPREV